VFLLSWVESLCFELTNQNCLQMIDYQRAVKPYLADHFLSEMVPFRLLWVNVSLWVIIISEVAIISSCHHAFCFIQSYDKIAKHFSWKYGYALYKHIGKKQSVIWESQIEYLKTYSNATKRNILLAFKIITITLIKSKLIWHETIVTYVHINLSTLQNHIKKLYFWIVFNSDLKFSLARQFLSFQSQQISQLALTVFRCQATSLRKQTSKLEITDCLYSVHQPSPYYTSIVLHNNY
jgi:hypothetical protein